jgi:hypothetical protein
MSSNKYSAYHVDLYGVARASYQLQASNDATAVVEARYFLKFHPSLEVWHSARFVARLLQEGSARVRGIDLSDESIQPN